MPEIVLRVADADPGNLGGFQYRFKIGDPATAHILEYEDAPGNYVHPAGTIDSGWIDDREWDVDWGDKFFGGHVTTVKVQVQRMIGDKYTLVQNCTFKRDFYIVGAALTTAVLRAYIDTLTDYSASVRKMAKVIAVKESNGTHFWPGAGVGTASHTRYPLREGGGGGGYGVMQLTTPLTLLTVKSIWNWQENVTKAMTFINTCYTNGSTYLDTHPDGVTDEMKRLEGYNRYNGGDGDRYWWWSNGPGTNNGVAEGWTKFGYIVCGTAGTDGYRDYNNDEVADAADNPYNIDNGPSGANTCLARAARYADGCLAIEP